MALSRGWFRRLKVSPSIHDHLDAKSCEGTKISGESALEVTASAKDCKRHAHRPPQRRLRIARTFFFPTGTRHRQPPLLFRTARGHISC
jgi:hypothetical protein